MNTRRAVIGIARHGVTATDDEGMSLDLVTDESIQRMYDQETTFGERMGVDPAADALILHSDKERTRATALARLAGIRNMTPRPVRQSDTRNYRFNQAILIRDELLSYEDLTLNNKAVNRMGLPAYTDWMLAHRHATQMEGMPVTPFQTIYDTRKPVLRTALHGIDAEKYRLILIATHGAIVDALGMAAVDAARVTPVTRFEEAGGQFEKEGIAYIIIDRKEKSGSEHARMHRHDTEFPIDLNIIRAY